MNSLFSPRTVSAARPFAVLLLSVVVVVEAEAAVVAAEVGESPAAAAAADGRGTRALLRAQGAHLILG